MSVNNWNKLPEIQKTYDSRVERDSSMLQICHVRSI